MCRRWILLAARRATGCQRTACVARSAVVTLTALVLGPPPHRVTAACQQGQVPAADFDGGPQAEQRQGRGVVTGVVTRHDRQSRPAHRLGSGPAAPTPAAARRPGSAPRASSPFLPDRPIRPGRRPRRPDRRPCLRPSPPCGQRTFRFRSPPPGPPPTPSPSLA